MTIGVVGAGIFGLSAALELARRGNRVSVFDQGDPPAETAASNDSTRVLRFEYGSACPLYVPLVEESRARYRELDAGSGAPLYFETGVLALAASFEPERHERISHDFLREQGWPVEVWGPEEARKRFPQFSYEGISAVTWNPQGGYLRAADAVKATRERAVEAGAKLERGRVVALEDAGAGVRFALEAASNQSGSLTCDVALIAVGAWLPTLLPELASFLTPTRQFLTYYRPNQPERFRAPAFPVWIHDLAESGWYGIPLDSAGLVKVARHQPGEPADPDGARVVTDEDRRTSRAFVGLHLPQLGADSLATDRGCLYALTPDGNFLIDQVPGRERVFVAGGGSGHGFKLGPAVGRLAADRIEGRPVPTEFAFDAPRTGRVA